jgi:hypothetical protein
MFLQIVTESSISTALMLYHYAVMSLHNKKLAGSEDLKIPVLL